MVLVPDLRVCASVITEATCSRERGRMFEADLGLGFNMACMAADILLLRAFGGLGVIALRF